ncbi:MAG: hypothetical protein OXP12_02785 [Thaumarchaeota archaeon]|nr:hypothetical protein [Nitrososphaerota archaeon]
MCSKSLGDCNSPELRYAGEIRKLDASIYGFEDAEKRGGNINSGREEPAGTAATRDGEEHDFVLGSSGPALAIRA